MGICFLCSVLSVGWLDGNTVIYMILWMNKLNFESWNNTVGEMWTSAKMIKCKDTIYQCKILIVGSSHLKITVSVVTFLENHLSQTQIQKKNLVWENFHFFPPFCLRGESCFMLHMISNFCQNWEESSTKSYPRMTKQLSNEKYS